MKVLKGILSFIVGVILTILLFTLSLTFMFKKVFQEELIVGVVKDEVVTKYIIDNEDSNLTDEQKDVIKNILGEEETNEILNIIVNNYIEYQSNENYTLSQKDVNIITNFALDHINIISELSNGEITEETIKENLTYENLDKAAHEGFKALEENENIEIPEEATSIIKTYSDVISMHTRLLIIVSIVGCILLLMLITWSLYKWMKTTGISLIISGVLISILYFGIGFVKELIVKQNDLGISLDNVNFNMIIIMGITEIVIGIILIIVNSIIKKNMNKEANNDK